MSNIDQLLALAEPCQLCPRQCGTRRLSGEQGFCQAGSEIQISYLGLHHGEEPPISGTRGSGTVFFGHCTMACVFCQNWQISQPPRGGVKSGAVSLSTISPPALAQKFLDLQAAGAHNINLVSPTQYAPWLAQAVSLAREKGLIVPIVYNTNGYERTEVLGLLADTIDIYLPDMKYADNVSAARYSQATNYTEHNLVAVKFMLKQKGLLQIKNDLAVQGVIVRHLVLPGLSKESQEILAALYSLNPELPVSLMSQYAPRHQAQNIPGLNRRLSAEEYAEAVAYAATLGLENVWTQEITSQDIFVPDFGADEPFAASIEPERGGR
ncbi:radical SAM protein [Candidatus Termititenax persephonae]|uniref:Radical SAM protein n=1 Tax=Candidatus Termititenax persephonae TaxID=2218525 RepID=A0A388THJ4_9BACT|nr:radical SAM protein [Candidatus Termititenax persephonae]